MDLDLTRVDYGNIGTTLPNCLRLLPIFEYKNQQQRVVVGDLDGNLQVFSIKKSEAHIHSQIYVGKSLSCIQLGGAVGTPLDKIFVATGNVVKGYNRKGKMFLSFTTNLTEPIKCMFVFGEDLITCGNHVYSHYKDCKDVGTYLCGDTIVDVVALCPNNTKRMLAVLACSGRVLRILEHCRVRQTVELDSVPTTLHIPKRNAHGDRVICGFADGKVSIFYFGYFTGDVKQQILVKPEEIPNAITCIDTFDMLGDEKDELLIGRRDGTIQVFTYTLIDDDVDSDPKQIYRECFPESISAVQGGFVYSSGFPEIVVLTYAGNIFGLITQVINISLTDKHVIRETIKRIPQKAETTETLNEKANIPQSVTVDPVIGLAGISNSLTDDAKIKTSQSLSEISISQNQQDMKESVKLSLAKPQEKYRLSTQVITSNLSVSSMLNVNDSLSLNKNDSTYHLFIEMPIPINQILLKSEASIDIIDSKHNSTAMIIADEFDLTSGYQFTGTARLQGTRNRFKMAFWSVEGQYGNLEAYIVPDMHTSYEQMRTYFIKPLSLHTRIHSFDETRPFNTLTLKGPFSQTDIHNWIEKCIPEVPERLASHESNELYFENCLIGTILQCKYGKGFVEFRSDNLSTISILKDYLSKEATKKRIRIEINSDINESSIPHVLKLIEPKIQHCIKIKTDHKFLQALLQVDIQNDEDFQCLMPEYQSILKRRNEIELDYGKISTVLSRYFGLVTDFYIDRFKFKGIFVKDKVPELIKLLDNYNFDDIVSVFCEKKIINNENKAQKI